ncbi:MAG: DNA-directed RNA polymerase [Thermoprotei archaeon]
MVYRLYRVKGVIRIPPHQFGKPLEEAAYEELRKTYEGVLTRDLGIIVAILDVKVNPLGKILMGDGATYHDVEFTIITFNPFQKEVVEGEVNTIISRGLFIDLGAQDGFVHISQIADERIEYDPTRQAFILKESRRTIERGDIVRARIYGVAIARSPQGLRVHLTMRQPLLGKVEWIKRAIERSGG